VEPRFLAAWRRYHRALKQRNALLRERRVAGLEAWTPELAQTGAVIQTLRERYVDSLIPRVQDYVRDLRGPDNIILRYSPGWSSDGSLDRVLRERMVQDGRLGYTRHGPHRADLIISAGAQPAHHTLSRGQQKVLVIAMRLAQAALLRERSGRQCAFLVDDLAAELDRERRRTVMENLGRLEAQVFVTGTDQALLPLPSDADAAVFHVEHGEVQEMVY
jgi:DNA replication and repair protein RecF